MGRLHEDVTFPTPHGRFREARSLLDYSYHSNYVISRQKVRVRLFWCPFTMSQPVPQDQYQQSTKCPL